MMEALEAVDPILLGVLASLAAGLMTGVGALPVLTGHSVSRRGRDGMLGFAAGVMLSASYFSLILPALDAAGGDGFRPALLVGIGLILGAVAIAGLNDLVPHEHFLKGREGPAAERLARVWLFVLAIAIHNFPEGMAVGVGFGSGEVGAGLALAIGIGLQNAPEGLAVALALRAEGYRATTAFWIATATGLVEPIGGLLGAATLTVASALLPWGLAFAAGAMLYVISHEIIPETHRHGHGNAATIGLLAGLVLMMLLDVGLA